MSCEKSLETAPFSVLSTTGTRMTLVDKRWADLRIPDIESLLRSPLGASSGMYLQNVSTFWLISASYAALGLAGEHAVCAVRIHGGGFVAPSAVPLALVEIFIAQMKPVVWRRRLAATTPF